MAKIKQIEVNGTTYDIEVDLTNYYTKTQVDNAISAAINNITDGEEESF